MKKINDFYSYFVRDCSHFKDKISDNLELFKIFLKRRNNSFKGLFTSLPMINFIYIQLNLYCSSIDLFINLVNLCVSNILDKNLVLISLIQFNTQTYNILNDGKRTSNRERKALHSFVYNCVLKQRIVVIHPLAFDDYAFLCLNKESSLYFNKVLIKNKFLPLKTIFFFFLITIP